MFLVLTALVIAILGGRARAGVGVTPADACGAAGNAITQSMLPYTTLGSTAGALNDVSSYCAGHTDEGLEDLQNVPGPDVFYPIQVGPDNEFQVRVTQPGFVEPPPIEEEGDAPSAFFAAAVYLVRPDCVTTPFGEPTGDPTACDLEDLFGSVRTPGAPVSFSASGLPPGRYYIGVDSRIESSGGPFELTITGNLGGELTSTELIASPNPSHVNEQVTFTATVTGDLGGTPTGSIVFRIDGVDGAPVPLTGTSAIATATFLTAGPHIVVAEYQPTGAFQPSGAGLELLVNRWMTTTTVSSLANTYPSPASFTATVASVGGGPTPTGLVTFSIDGGPESAGQTLAGGMATFNAGVLTGGSHTVRAFYQGDTAFDPSSSSNEPLYSHTVNPGVPNISLVSSHPAPTPYGTLITFDVTVSPPTGGAQPQGSIEFFLDDVSVDVDGLSGLGTAQWTSVTIPFGLHTIRATYTSSDSNYGTLFAEVNQQITLAPTVVTIEASPPSPSAPGTPVVFTATVGGIDVPTGTVLFTVDGADQLPALAVEGSNSASITRTLPPGTHAITATFSGDTNHAGSTTGISHIVNKITATVAIVAIPPTSVYLEPIFVTATVTPSTSPFGAPGGTIEFFDDTLSLGTATLNASGEATLPTGMSVGTHSNVHAVYAGDLTFTNATSSPVTVTVNQASTETTLVSSSNPSISGNDVSFIAHVKALLPGNGIPDGNVVFTDGPATVATIAVNSNGDAIFTTSSLSVGTHSLGAAYSGSLSYIASLATPVLQTVASTGVNIQIVSSNNPANRAAPVTFTATVLAAGIAQSPTGTVTFSADGVAIGTSPIDASHQAEIETSSLTSGTHPITAHYDGDATFPAGPTATVLQHIGLATSVTTLVSSLNPATVSDDITFSATVTSPIPGVISGKIVLRDGPSVLHVSPDLTESATISYTTKLTAGSHAITAVYSGDTQYAPGISDTLGQLVNLPAVDGGVPPVDAGVDSGTMGPVPEGGTPIPPIDGGVPPIVGNDGGFNINIPVPDENCECRSVGAGSFGAGQAGAALFAGLGLAIAFARRRNRRD